MRSHACNKYLVMIAGSVLPDWYFHRIILRSRNHVNLDKRVQRTVEGGYVVNKIPFSVYRNSIITLNSTLPDYLL